MTESSFTDQEQEGASIQQQQPPLAEPLLLHSEKDASLAQERRDDGNDDDEPEFRRLLFFKSVYFVSGLSASSWGRFGIIYYNRVRHLSAEQIGILQGVQPLLGFCSQPFWGWVADSILQSRKRVFLLTQAARTVSLLFLAANFVDNFGKIMACIVSMALFRSSGVMDAHCLDFLGTKHAGRYGSIRLWSSVSWGLGAVIMGWITDTYDFSRNFFVFGGMQTLLFLVTALGLPARSINEQARYTQYNSSRLAAGENENNNSSSSSNEADGANPQSRREQRPRLQTLFDVLCRAPVVVWLTEVAVIGAGMALVDSFLFVYLQNDLQASTELCGWTVGVTVLFCLPIFYHSEFLLENAGHDALFMASMLAYAVRVFGYTLLTPHTVHWVLALEMTHGITFACMWTASVDYAAAIAPAEWSTTVQTVLSSVLTCVGGGLGPFVGGLMVQWYGAVIMYRGAACVVAAVLSLHAGLWFLRCAGHDAFLKRLQTERRLHQQEQQQQQQGDNSS